VPRFERSRLAAREQILVGIAGRAGVLRGDDLHAGGLDRLDERPQLGVDDQDPRRAVAENELDLG
jgi:hypothetical protein